MINDKFLNLNPRKIMQCLSGILNELELQKIESELRKNSKQLIKLGEAHLRFANGLSGRDCWRQRVSRAYYACYSVSKALRLAKTGFYSTESKDHQKICDFPDDFPNKDIWKDKLTKFRADRNIADYDHLAKEKNLEYTSSEYLSEAYAFLQETKKYMRGKNLI